MTQAELITLKFEYDNRVRIFNDSQRIAQETVSFDVFCRRFSLLEEFVKWSCDMKDKGAPIKLTLSREQSFQDLCKFYNFHCLRISKAIAEKATSGKSAMQASREVTEIARTLKTATNETEVREELHQLIGTLNSQIFV